MNLTCKRLAVVIGCLWASIAWAANFEIGTNDFLLDGSRFQIRCGEMHAARIPAEYWQHRLKMAKAMGLNTVCAYLFWNLHEPEPARFNFAGNADMARFCKLAQKEGLKVILRPGPYACAEWDFGGFPYWLLKDPEMKLRTRHPCYLAACKRYLAEVGKQLAPLQISRGGPIIMVQVENEYGSYGKDKEYIGLIRDYLVEAGFNVPLFTCDGPVQLKNDTRDDIFCVVNFGSDPEAGFKALREIRPTGPLMCGEYYPGWFDSWGKPHHLGDTARIARELEWMLQQNCSFSIYMAHGGTSFGFSVGANCPPFSPQLTSYDYDAPISEAGWITPKFCELRTLFAKYLLPGESIPEAPPANPVIEIPPIRFSQCAPLHQNLPKPRKEETIKPMEMFDQAYGCILYRKYLPPGPEATLEIQDVHDYALVILSGSKFATLDRRHGQNSVTIPARTAALQLDILVDTFGRVNYGAFLHDRKGITEKVELVADKRREQLRNWEVFNLPLNQVQLAGLQYRESMIENPAFFRATFQLATTGDTFLDFSTWGKGVVWVNGHNLGRYWRIGPQQTLYCPGPWLKKGENEIVVFEVDGTTNRVVQGLPKPVLDKLNRGPGGGKHRQPGQTIDLSKAKKHHSGQFSNNSEWQEVRFPAMAARYIVFEALNAHGGGPFTTCAELELLDGTGKKIEASQWGVYYADSEEIDGEQARADNVYDGNPETFWHSEWRAAQPEHPHQVALDLIFEQPITGLRYLPRQDRPSGRIKDFNIYFSAEPIPLITK